VAEYVITSLEPARLKGWSELTIEGRPPFFIDSETIYKRSLKAGDILNDSLLKKIREEADTAWLKNRGMRILSRRMVSERDLRRKLSEERRPTAIREAVISQFKEYGMLDDMQFAASFVRTQMARGPKSRPYLKKLLFAKGIFDPIASDAIKQHFDDYDEKAAVKKIAEKKYETLKHLPPPKARSRLINFLRSRGFPWDTIRDAVNVLSGDRFNDAPGD
jgi:regulatory protein